MGLSLRVSDEAHRRGAALTGPAVEGIWRREIAYTRTEQAPRLADRQLLHLKAMAPCRRALLFVC